MKICVRIMPIVMKHIVKLPEAYIKILKFNQDEKSMKIPFVIKFPFDTKSLLEKYTHVIMQQK